MCIGKESIEFRQHVDPSDDNALDFLDFSALDKTNSYWDVLACQNFLKTFMSLLYES
jgi:hypothetical protein